MFIENDIYTSVGSVKLYNSWTKNVSKFDSSSSYNFEQDNLPLFDLEERDHLLWERLGFPTSAVVGVGLVVSSVPDEQCNAVVFNSVSACIAALPEVINCPYFIEICSFGQLGKLELGNKIFGPRGSIEIVNRLFGKAHTYVSGVTSKFTDLYPTTQAPYNVYGLASSVGVAVANEAFYGAVPELPSLHRDFVNSKSIILNSNVFSSTGGNLDTRLTNNLTVFAKKGNDYETQRLTAALAGANPIVPWTGTNSNGRVSFRAYEYDTESLVDQVDTYDASCINQDNGTEIQWKDANQDPVNNVGVAVAYGNRFTSVKIINCNGPIYFRNFYVDGRVGSIENYGIEITNCTNILLESCAAVRCSKAGLYVNNSNLNISRGFVAYRNYGFDENGDRIGRSWAARITNQDYNNTDFGAGILAVDSTVDFQSTLIRDNIITEEYFNTLSISATFYSPAYTALDWMTCLSRNSIGIYAKNSAITGGQRELQTFVSPRFNAYNLYSELNMESGLMLENSTFEFDGKLFFLGNFNGINAVNAILYTDQLVSKFNYFGTKLSGSILRYNKNLYQPDNSATSDSIRNIHHNSYILNGVPIQLVDSIYEPIYSVSSNYSYYDRFVVSATIGISHDIEGLKGKRPLIHADKNSRIKLIHPGLDTGDLSSVGEASYGAAISCTNGSVAILQGSSKYATKVIGPQTFAAQERKAGLFAGGGSTIKIHGPTVIARFAVDALADSNSKIIFEPHTKDDGVLDVESFNLDDRANHTMVELHSTRSCLVANNHSEIVIKDLGDYSINWSNSSYGLSSLTNDLDYDTSNRALYTSGGYIQFYPNPNDIELYPDDEGDFYGVQNPSINLYSVNSFLENAQGYKYFLAPYIGQPENASLFSSITYGGMCVRAVNDSIVNIYNVNFPCGWWNPSSVVYDAIGNITDPLCDRLFIFNIADNSQITAKYVSVSSIHPADTSYFGPRGTWNNASAAPSSTPDTGVISILDFYGPASGHPWAKSFSENRGPFRLYFSTDPACNWLTLPNNTRTGYANQVFSQGYNFSSTLAASGNISAVYTSLVDTNGSAAGFYYAKDMIAGSKSLKAILDDSAANTFANAKHCSVGKSNIPKLVSILYPHKGSYGGDSADSVFKEYGKGLRSVNTFDLDGDN